MFFKHSWLRHLFLKIIPTRPLRHVWPEVVMENHTHTLAVHGKSHIMWTPINYSLWCMLQLIYNITSVVTPCWSLPLGITLHSTLGDKSDVVYTRIPLNIFASRGCFVHSAIFAFSIFLAQVLHTY